MLKLVIFRRNYDDLSHFFLDVDVQVKVVKLHKVSLT